MTSEQEKIGELLNVVDAHFYAGPNGTPNSKFSNAELERINTVLYGLRLELLNGQEKYVLTDEKLHLIIALIDEVAQISRIYPKLIWFPTSRKKILQIINELKDSPDAVQFMTQKVRCLVIPENAVPRPLCDHQQPYKNCDQCYYKSKFSE